MIMSIKVVTLLERIDYLIGKENASIISHFYDYKREKGSSENNILNNWKVIIEYVNYLNETKLYYVINKEHITIYYMSIFD